MQKLRVTGWRIDPFGKDRSSINVKYNVISPSFKYDTACQVIPKDMINQIITSL